MALPYHEGDRVINVAPNGETAARRNYNHGREARVIDITEMLTFPVTVVYDDGSTGSGQFCDYKKINKKTTMEKLGVMMKKLLDADTQTLVKAGYINGDLDLTNEGKEMLWTMVFDANKTALVAAAQAKIDEESKKN